MATLREQLLKILPEILPTKPEDSLYGTDLAKKVKPLLQGAYSDHSIRQHFSVLSADPTSPIAKVEQGVGYYLRQLDNNNTRILDGSTTDTILDDSTILTPEQSRTLQREEKFRSIFMRYAELNNQFPMHIEHTKGAKRVAGVNKWKFPDVVVLDWEVGQITDNGYRLDRDLLEIKKSLGEQPFKVMSVELKVELTLSSFRENFFQCVSNSKWAHSAYLAVASRIADRTLAEELRRLGTSYDVSVVSYGFDLDYLDKLPSSDKILAMKDSDFESISDKITISLISSGRGRGTLDWEHIRDLRVQSDDFNQIFEWVAYCLEKKAAYRFKDYSQIAKLETRYT